MPTLKPPVHAAVPCLSDRKAASARCEPTRERALVIDVVGLRSLTVGFTVATMMSRNCHGGGLLCLPKFCLTTGGLAYHWCDSYPIIFELFPTNVSFDPLCLMSCPGLLASI